MTGTMMAAADADSLFTVLRETSFGMAWVARLALGVVLLALTMRRSGEHHPDWAIVWLAGLLLASLALVGHTQTSDDALWVAHMSADGAHLLAAGAWLGGCWHSDICLCLCDDSHLRSTMLKPLPRSYASR